MAAEKKKLGSKGQAWFCTTGLPTDVVIEVGDMSFHLHKFPLMTSSKKLHHIITEQEQNPQRREDDDDEKEIEEEEEEEALRVALPDFPGGSETFEAAAKFCYGVKLEFTPWNAVPLRCAAEYLEMTEDVAESNLIARTDRFLAQSVLCNLRESVKALKSCDDAMPAAEELGLVQRCIDAIVTRACSADPASLLGWSEKDGGDDRRVLWNGIETGVPRRKGGPRSSSFAAAAAAADSWFEDLTMLSLPVYKRLIAAMREREMSSEAIEGSLISYAKRSIPGLSRSSRKHSSAPVASEQDQRELLETVITNLPPVEKVGQSWASRLTTARFLFGLLRTANILRASEASRAALERRIAAQLEQAALDDLLLPNYSYLSETLYDVDCVERIIAHFLQGLNQGPAAAREEEEEHEADRTPSHTVRLTLVGKLVDGYLAEIASDANLRPDKFCGLALALPDQARLYDDGLYRAVDLYLKAHPGLSDGERERICGAIDCQKLTLEACTHAAQNERLPLRAVVQVLFFEQLQLRQAIAGTLLAADDRPERPSDGPREGGEAWRAAARENQVLRLDMDSMRSRVHELERECSSMKKAIAKMDRRAGGAPPAAGGDGGAAGGGRRGSLARRMGCKFKTQVCDSHERAVVESRRSRTEDSA